MAVNGISSGAQTGNQTSGINSGNALGSESQFLQLLVEQLQNQDPLNPVTSTDFATQLTQFSTLDGITQLNQNISSLLLLQDLSQGASLIGKTISYAVNGSSNLQQGTVSGVQINNGQLQLTVGSSNVGLDQVRGIVGSH
jgi:flagellar basal-body rod modification protein FlgD